MNNKRSFYIILDKTGLACLGHIRTILLSHIDWYLDSF